MLEETEKYVSVRSRPEKAVVWHLFGYLLLCCLALGGNAQWAPPFLIVSGAYGVAISFFFRGAARRGKFKQTLWHLLVLAPVLLTACLLIVGMWFPTQKPLPEVPELLALQETAAIMPASTMPAKAWLQWLLQGVIFISAANILLICHTPAAFLRLLQLCGMTAVWLAILGLAQAISGIDRVLFFIPALNPDFFSTFIHPNHWGAFALLWLVVLCSLTVSQRRLFPRARLLHQDPAQLWIGALVLAVAICVSTPAFYGVAACLCITISSLHLAVLNAILKKGTAGIAVPVLIGIAALASATTQLPEHGTGWDSWFVQADSEEVAQRLIDEREALRRDAQQVIAERPLWGWGGSSFGVALGFFQVSDLGGKHYESPRSDVIQSLVERGIIGTGLLVVMAIGATAYWLLGQPFRVLSTYLLGACALGILMAVGDFPFMNPAFMLSFWIIYFASMGWANSHKIQRARRRRKRSHEPA